MKRIGKRIYTNIMDLTTSTRRNKNLRILNILMF